MSETRLGAIETRFADIIWSYAPIKTTDLIKLAEAELGWKRTTTYTVLKRLSERGIFRLDDGIVSVITSKEDFFSKKSHEVVSESFGGSLPAFIAAFTSRKNLTEEEIKEIQSIIDKMKGV